MKIIKFFTKPLCTITTLAVLAIICMPLSAEAASTKPTCSLKVTTLNGETKIKNKGDVSINKGEEINIAWDSKNAKTATDKNGNNISISGSEKFSPTENTKYSYKFMNGNKKVTCEVAANIVGITIDTSTLTTSKSKPKLSGTATGAKSVKVVISEEGSSKTVFSSKSLKVSNNKWKVEVTKKLSNGSYKVEVFDVKDSSKAMATGTLTIGTNSNNSNNSSSTKSNSTLAVSSVPLLVGGTARGGSAVSVSYLQVTNIGKESVIVEGFNLKQNGSTPVGVIIGFTTVDDRNGSRGYVGGAEGSVLFKNGVAFVPVTNVALAPREMKLFTIKAVLSSNVQAFIGTQLMIDVVSVDTNAKVSGSFPIRGTTWTIGL